MKRDIDVKLLEAHPLNRDFGKAGSEWWDFVESVKTHGVMECLFVRPQGKVYQVLAGHRRLAAALEAGIVLVPCQVVEMDDVQALVFLMNSNLQRSDLSVMDEAKLVRELKSMGLSDDQICEQLSREMYWLELRQAVFDFDEDVQSYLHTGSLSEGAFRQLMKVPVDLREEAQAVVLGFTAQGDEPMSEDRARQYIDFSLIPEWEAEQKWEQGSDKLKKSVTKILQKLCKGAENPPTVLVMPYKKGPEGLGGDLVSALEVVPDEVSSREAVGSRLAEDFEVTWAWIAADVGAPVYVLAPENSWSEKRMFVSRRVLHDDAAARAEHGKPGYLLPRGVVKRSPEVQKALAVLDGEPEADYDPTEKMDPVATPGDQDGKKIEQRMEHAAMIDIGKVKWLGKIAFAHETDPEQDMHEGVPSWARLLIHGGNASAVCDAMEWVLSLKVGGDK